MGKFEAPEKCPTIAGPEPLATLSPGSIVRGLYHNNHADGKKKTNEIQWVFNDPIIATKTINTGQFTKIFWKII